MFHLHLVAPVGHCSVVLRNTDIVLSIFQITLNMQPPAAEGWASSREWQNHL